MMTCSEHNYGSSISYPKLIRLAAREGFAVSVFLLVLWVVCTTPVTSQTTWFKYEGNPVLDVGPPGSWNDEGVLINRVIFKDSVYHAWHSGNDGLRRRVGYATSPDGIHWTKRNSGKPVLDLGAEAVWDHREATFPYVVFAGSRYHMWYYGFDGITIRIGYASSPNGIAWKKHIGNPVLTPGPSAWDAGFVTMPAVIGPDATGGFKMWYSGNSEPSGYHVEIGYATAVDPTTWIKYPNPVLTTGPPGSWDDRSLLSKIVLYNGQVYEMWYAGSRGTFNTSRTGYATSMDGIHWTKNPDNPVLLPGPADSWDDEAAFVGDVLLDGSIYRMWYGGFDGLVTRTGYAISPRGADVMVSADNMYVLPGKDTVLIRVGVNDPSRLSFSAEIESSDKHPIDHLELFDDGAHGDGLPGDGVFANRWVPQDERNYSVDLKLRLDGKEPLTFELNNAGAFTTIGPVKLDDLIFANDPTPNPGDTIVIKLALRNHGSSVLADSVLALISTNDTWITDVTSVSPMYGTIAPGRIATTAGYYRFFISPNCPLDTDIPFDVQISSAGVSLWRDTFTISVLPPWWRSNWAYGLYGMIVLGLFFVIRKAEMRRLRVKHEREMERFQMEKLKEVDQLKSRFFANISHEFRTPLTLIEGPVRQLRSGEYKGDPSGQYDLILRNSQRLLQLVNQLLDLSKIESGEMKLHARELDIVEVVRGFAASFESLAKQKGINFHIECPEEPIIGWFDHDAIEKIVTNLLSNAFKFTSEGEEVVLKVIADPSLALPLVRGGDDISPFTRGRERGGRERIEKVVTITVSDTGIGIPEEELPHIFDRFYQVDASQTREHEGTGIGLALTKELVELHKGEITVTSEVGKGSIFTVRLPLSMEDFKAEQITDSAPTIYRPSPITNDLPPPVTIVDEQPETDASLPLLLIVEDNADMRKYMRTYLDNSYQVLEAANGDEGLEKAIETIPDLIISDVMMPKMDGFTLCGKLKTDERTSHIPIILLTAKAGTDHKIEGLETGADDYVTKPFDAKELRVRVKNLIEQRHRLRERFRKEGTIALKEIAVTSADERFMKRAMEVIESHISDQNFSAEQFAGEMFLGRMQLHRKMRALTDLSPWQFVRDVRLRRAADLLRKHSANISDIAYQVGYDSPSKFSQAFREEFGKTPSQYQSTDGT